MAHRLDDERNLLLDIKRIAGRPSEDPSLAVFAEQHAFQLDVSGKWPRIVLPNLNATISPENVLGALLLEIVRRASEQFGVPLLRRVVVSVPAIFHDAQRSAVLSACHIAGLEVELLVVELSAASMGKVA